jgi:hypothetical protein
MEDGSAVHLPIECTLGDNEAKHDGLEKVKFYGGSCGQVIVLHRTLGHQGDNKPANIVGSKN